MTVFAWACCTACRACLELSVGAHGGTVLVTSVDDHWDASPACHGAVLAMLHEQGTLARYREVSETLGANERLLRRAG